jgi:hypothetical protein
MGVVEHANGDRAWVAAAVVSCHELLLGLWE